MGTGGDGILEADGLGAARGQRFREGPCASHPTRQFPKPQGLKALPTHIPKLTISD
jgi:hypothetical protein